MFYSCWFEYDATGEGVTVGLMYCQAKDDAGAMVIAEKEFGDFFGKCVETQAGIKSDGYFKSLAPPWVIEKFTKMENGLCLAGCASWHSILHLNYS